MTNEVLADTGVRSMLMRGGSSKGLYFVADDLPDDIDQRNQLLLSVMGSPDARQIDGVGGAHPLTSKVAVVEVSDRDDADVSYLFLQVSVDDPLVSDRQNCGNLLAGVGPFAIERGLVDVATTARRATVRIHMINTDSVATATFPVANAQPQYIHPTGIGDVSISGVPGTASPIQLDFADIAGGSTGALLPTGQPRTTIDGVDCTLVDNGMPVVVLRADAIGITGYESCADLEANDAFRARIEAIRLQAGVLMNLGDVTNTTVPKITVVAAPQAGGALCTRTFIPHRCHDAIGVLGAVSVATAALLPGSPAQELCEHDGTDVVTLEHPTGTFAAVLSVDTSADELSITRAGIVRTARKLFDGTVYP